MKSLLNSALLKSASSKKTLLASVLTAAVLAGCGSNSSNNSSSPVATGQLRIVHASPNAPEVNVTANGTNLVSELDYAESSGFLTVDAGEYDIVVEGIVPGGNLDVITVDDFQLNQDDRTTVIAVDEVATITPLVVAESAAEPATDEVAIRVIHAAQGAPAVDVYVTAPGDSLVSSTPALSFAFSDTVDAGALAAGAVQIRVTLAGTQTVVYDSGTVDLAGFAGQRILLAAVDTTNATTSFSSPVKLLAITDTAVLTLLDTDTTAAVKVVHASPDAPEVEVFASSSALGTAPVELIDAISYPDVFPTASTTAAVPAASDYALDVAPNTDTITDSVFNASGISLAAGVEYSVIAAGRLLSTPAFNLLLTADDNRSVATQASVKIIHGAPAAGDVDIFVTPAGTVGVTDIENATTTATPALSAFSFGTITDYIDLAPGSYDIRVVAAGAVAINVEALNLTPGLVATAIARGPSEPSGTPTDFSLVLLTNQ